MIGLASPIATLAMPSSRLLVGEGCLRRRDNDNGTSAALGIDGREAGDLAEHEPVPPAVERRRVLRSRVVPTPVFWTTS